jgi:hypothetical protein
MAQQIADFASHPMRHFWLLAAFPIDLDQANRFASTATARERKRPKKGWIFNANLRESRP